MNKEVLLRIAGIENDSIVDGPGLRLTVFTQGCPHKCPGCHNPNTQTVSGGYIIHIGEIVAAVDKNPLLDGVTYSGGEPFLQYEPLTELSVELKKRGLHIIVYTGYTFEQIMAQYEKYKNFLSFIDVLIDGPYLEEQKSYELSYRGSKNQRIIDVAESIRRGAAVLLEV